jgi:hypothetical protein
VLRDINREISIPGIEAYPLSHGELKLTLELPELIFTEINDLAEHTGRTLASVFRNSLALFKIAADAEKMHHRLVVLDADGEIVETLSLPREQRK